jgi:hypothetical protein
VILQAQKISSSGRYQYSTDDGIRLAHHAIKHNSKTYFFSEWGIQDVSGHSKFTESIYTSMAKASGSKLIPVGRVWEAVFEADPNLTLYSSDKNHQSRLGASLTSLVLASYILNEPASVFQDFDDSEANDSQWKLFLEKVSSVQSESSY